MSMVVAHWPANGPAIAACLLVAAAHLAGTRRMAAAGTGGAGRPGERAQPVLFHLGLLTVLLAIVSPVGYWSGRLIWVRSVQDLLLAIAAPALIVLGAPWLALRAALGLRRPAGPRQRGDEGLAAAQDRPGDRPVAAGWLPLPVLAAVGFNLAWCGWHLPGPYDAARAHPALLAAEMISYLALGVLLWSQLIGSWPYAPALTPLRRVALLTATVAAGTVLAIALVFSSGVLYPGYAGGAHRAFSVVADQQVGGGVLWTLMLPAYIVTAVALLTGWLKQEESHDVAAGLDRLLTSAGGAKPAWPSRPGLR